MGSRVAVEKTADGEKYRRVRGELRVKLSEASFHSGIDTGRLSRFEHGIGFLTPVQRERLSKYLHSEALRRHRQLSRVVASLSGATAPRAALDA